jgi:hypothetical protein
MTEINLVEILLPVTDNEGRQHPRHLFALVERELTERFGGVTSFTRAPAHGVTEDGGRKVHDDIIVVEVMTETLDRDWWASYRRTLEDRFRQEEIVIRAIDILRL